MNERLHVVCFRCEAVNRLPAVRLGDGPRCGRCSSRLFSGQAVELTSRNFQLHIERNDVPVVVDFWASWCGPCRVMGPIFDQAALSVEPRARFAKVNVEVEGALAERHAIRAIPATVVFRGGREIGRQGGAMSLQGLVRWIQSLL